MSKKVILSIVMAWVLLQGCPVDADTVIPTSMNWLNRWKAVIAFPEMHPSLRESVIQLSLRPDRSIHNHTVQLTNVSGRVVGSLFIAPDWSRVIGVSSKYIFKVNVKEIDKEQSIAIAEEFIKRYYMPPANSRCTIKSSETTDEYGRWQIIISYAYRDITVKAVTIFVNYEGYIVEYSDFDLEHNSSREVIRDIIESPGDEYVRRQIQRLLGENMQAVIEVKGVSRKVDYSDDGIPGFYWIGDAYKTEGDIVEQSLVVYEENNKTIRTPVWRRFRSWPANTPRSPLLYTVHPMWSWNGAMILWGSNARWLGLPSWHSSSPRSIAILELMSGRHALYRPLPDYPNLSIAYSLPSLSPDGRWLAIVLPSNTLGLVDMKRNRIYYFAKQHGIVDRVSWDRDSRHICFVDKLSKSAVVYAINSDACAPCDTSAKVLRVNGELAAIEFSSDGLGSYLALFRERQAADNENAWKLVSMREGEGGMVNIEPLLTNIKQPQRMHVSKDGATVLLSTDGMLMSYYLQTQQHSTLQLPDNDNPLLDRFVCKENMFDWDLSPDGKSMVFNAVDKQTGDVVILTTNIDMNDPILRCAPDLTTTYPRYQLQSGLGYIVGKEYIPLALLERLKMIDEIPWKSPFVNRQIERYDGSAVREPIIGNVVLHQKD